MDHPLACGRRAAIRGLTLGATAALVACADDEAQDGDRPVTPLDGDGDEHEQGRLSYRPRGPGRPTKDAPTGSFRMDVAAGRPAALHVPDTSGPLRLVVLLHGAGGNPERTRQLLEPYAAEHRLLVLAAASRGPTWDVIQGGFGPDVETIDTLLDRTTRDYVIDGITVAGFSDGASYALTLGLSNGDVFDAVIAFSPGFEASQVRHGEPRFFVSHGTGDRVLPIERCSRRLVPALERDGYDVRYEEFEGGHEVPTAMRRDSVAWLGQR